MVLTEPEDGLALAMLNDAIVKSLRSGGSSYPEKNGHGVHSYTAFDFFF